MKNYHTNHIKIPLIKLFMAHMVSSLSSNTKPNPPFLCHRTGLKPLSKTLCFNPGLPIAKCTNKLTHPTSIYRPLARVSNGLSDTHDHEKRREILPPGASVSGSVPDISCSNGHRIWFSDVIVDRPKRLFGGRKWNSLDIGTASVVVIMHLISIFAPFTFNWNAFRVAVALYFATGLLGICLSFHRNLSHRSFRLPKWLEYFCAYCGVLALQGNPIDWVSTHRYHHQYCDSSKDPHSPIEGFWFSHMNWLFDTDAVIDRCGEASNVLDLEKQGFYRFIRSTYIFHPLALGVLLYALGGIPYIVWGMGVRTIWVYHITWLVNSACHVWGTQSWNTGDLSTNNWWVALLSFGEGWHNNHHAFEYSARHGLQWWEIDMTWYTVRLLQLIGFAKDVKLPTDAHRKRMAFGSDSECIAG